MTDGKQLLIATADIATALAVLFPLARSDPESCNVEW